MIYIMNSQIARAVQIDLVKKQKQKKQQQKKQKKTHSKIRRNVMETDPLCEALPNPNSISRLVRKKPKSIKSPWKMLIASNNSGSGRQRLLNPGESGGLLWRPAWGGDWSLHRWSHTFVALCDE